MPGELELTPAPRRQGPVCGSAAGALAPASPGGARVGDGWLASAYNTTPERFAAARARLARALADRGRDPASFPNGLATMWTWVSKDRAEADRMLTGVLAPILRREPDELRGQVCVGPPEHCAELLSRYAEAGCERVFLWPLGDERASSSSSRAR